MEIYADVFIFENFIVNFFLLSITMKCIRHKCKMVSLVISGFIGGVYSLVLIIPKLNIIASLPCELLVAIIMLRMVYGKTSVLNMIKLLLVFLLITCALSGICFLFSLRQNIYLIGSTFKIEKYSVKYIMLGIMIIYIIFSRLIDHIKDKIFTNEYIFEIEFEVQGQHCKFRSFLDTGNELREPITNLPCILIEENLINHLNFNDKNTYNILYSSIGYGGSLKGIRVNNIKIKNKNYLLEKIDAIICPCKERLSKEDEFNALLSRGVVCEGDVYGKVNSAV